MVIDCEALHKLLQSAVRFTYNSKGDTLFKAYLNGNEIPYPENWERDNFRNGVYVMFEEGEKFQGIDRIVRIGINRDDNNFYERLKSHYLGTRKSIFRKHIERCLDNPRCPLQCGNAIKRQRVLNYIQQNISFCVIRADDRNMRRQLESMLIATVAQNKQCRPSDNWLGIYHPNEKISDGNLWNIQHLKSHPLDREFSELVRKNLIMSI